jgi:hypothetical protein
MRRKQALSRTQQRAVERLAKGQGCTCIDCGSADYLVSDTNALRSFGNVNVALFCNNPDAEHPEGVLALDVCCVVREVKRRPSEVVPTKGAPDGPTTAYPTPRPP